MTAMVFMITAPVCLTMSVTIKTVKTKQTKISLEFLFVGSKRVVRKINR